MVKELYIYLDFIFPLFPKQIFQLILLIYFILMEEVLHYFYFQNLYFS